MPGTFGFQKGLKVLSNKVFRFIQQTLVNYTYQKIRELLVTRTSFFNDIRTLLKFICLKNWSEFFSFILKKYVPFKKVNSSWKCQLYCRRKRKLFMKKLKILWEFHLDLWVEIDFSWTEFLKPVYLQRWMIIICQKIMLLHKFLYLNKRILSDFFQNENCWIDRSQIVENSNFRVSQFFGDLEPLFRF